ncbi:curli-like amyloid fiber formation chaperone CsgH [Aeromonas sp. NJAU223]|uniref:curli-like amyloid fiber formation chaperone CsgH n=1 Tax=Aeromonas sp. NJAU223 TaxID=3115650 RepID=UPI003DA9DD6C
MSLCASGGLRAPFSLGVGRRRGLHARWAGALLCLCALMPVQAALQGPAPEVTLNALQDKHGLSLAPMLLSQQGQTLYFRLDLWSQSGAGQSHQQQRGRLVLAADRPHGLGRLTLGLSCPYHVRFRLQLWQEERLLSETERPFQCGSTP